MHLRPERGTTLLEAMIAVSVLLVAALGTLGLHVQQLRMNADARHVTEATALARDMVENIALWPWSQTQSGGLLENTNADNDTDIADDAFKFEGETFEFDHSEDELGDDWTGLQPRAGFTRYWNVAYPDDADANGVKDAVRIAVIVRWKSEVGWRRVVLLTTKANPAEVH